ncbi:MAG: class I adenylate-forming enzyme family protein [Alphaproteobacteria bacterium]
MTTTPIPTAARLAEIAAQAPDHIAVRDRGRSVTFSEFYSDLGRIFPAVTGFGVRKGSVAAVGWDGLYRHWLLTLAFECLGVTTFTCHRDGPPDHVPADTVVCPDDGWWQAALDGPVADLTTQSDPGFAPRLVASSGTTGSPKLMAPTVLQEAFRQDATRSIYGYGPDSRFLVGVGFIVQADHRRATVCLRAGGTCLYEGEAMIEDAILSARPTHVVLMPGHLLGIEGRSDDLCRYGPLNVAAVGGAVPDAARTLLTERFGFTLTESYGTNETGPIANVGSDGWASPLPGVTVRIVGDYGAVLPPGTDGTVEISSPGTVDGYRNYPEATAARFRDGWFRPGDVGRMDADGRLRLTGRIDDILNVGGMKISAGSLDRRLQALPELQDGAAAAFVDENGRTALALFIVPSGDIPNDVLEASVMTVIPRKGIGTVRVIRATGIPRTDTGKVRRRDLRAFLDSGQKT